MTSSSNQATSPGIVDSAKTHWRKFLPMWIFAPTYMVLGPTFLNNVPHPDLVWYVVIMPIFFWSFFRASSPWRKREIPYPHAIIWTIICPFVLAALVTFVRVELLLHFG
jgi:hypothetical protein